MSGLELIGGLLSAGATVAGGIAQKNAADDEAAQLKAKGNEAFAASQRDADQARKQADLANSRAQALAAASGGGAGADAPTIVKIMSDTAGQGELNAGAQLYNGISQRNGYNAQAVATRKSGRASFLGSVLGAGGAFASSTGKGYADYKKTGSLWGA